MTKSSEKLLAIIAETVIKQGCGDAEGKTILTLWFLGVSDQYRGRKIRKSYFFADVPPDSLQRDFLTLGARIEKLDELPALAEKMVGRIVRMSIVPDENGRRRFYIDEYVGSDDPSKYISQNDRVQE